MSDSIETVLKYYGRKILGFGADMTVVKYKHNSKQYWVYPSKPPCEGEVLVTIDIGLCMSIMAEMIKERGTDE